MNKNLLYGLVAVVVVGGGVALFMMKGPSDLGTGATSSMAQATSLKELLSSQNPQKCSFEQKTTGAEASGNVYVGGGKMRGDFGALANGQTVQSHMVVMDNTAYVWTDAAPTQGVKMSFDAVSGAQGQQKNAVDINQKFDYSCTPWSGDGSVFTLPSTVTFTDMTAMMNQMKVQTGATVGAPSATNQCAMCDQIPDASGKTQCRKALNCK